MMPVCPEELHLRDAIKTTLVQLCKVGLIYQTDVCIEGTVGLTVDSKKVILIHFDEKFSSSSDVILNVQPVQENSAVPTTPQQQNSEGDLGNLRHLGAETLSSLHDYLSGRSASSHEQETVFCKSDTIRKDHIRPPETPSKLFSLSESIAIELDSDSESFGDMTFSDVSEVKVKAFQQTHDKRDVKNTIVIDDNNFFQSEPEVIEEAFGGEDNESVAESGRQISSESIVCATNPSVPSVATRASSHESPVVNSTDSSVRAKFECEQCRKILPSQSLLEAHLVGVHGITESETLGKIVHYACSYCPKKFRFLANMNKHMTAHVEMRPHRCKMCHNSYRHSSSLDIHMEVHANSLQCRPCKKTYANKKLLQKHIVYMHEKGTS